MPPPVVSPSGGPPDGPHSVPAGALGRALAGVEAALARSDAAPVLVEGPPGAGKTTLLRRLEQRAPADVDARFVPFVNVGPLELERWLAGLGEGGPGGLEEGLRRRREEGGAAWLLVDEAQSMPAGSAARLGALHAAWSPVLRLVLAGTRGAALEAVLADLGGSVTRVRLDEPLRVDEVAGLLEARAASGEVAREALPDAASLHRQTGGVPGLVVQAIEQRVFAGRAHGGGVRAGVGRPSASPPPAASPAPAAVASTNRPESEARAASAAQAAPGPSPAAAPPPWPRLRAVLLPGLAVLLGLLVLSAERRPPGASGRLAEAPFPDVGGEAGAREAGFPTSPAAPVGALPAVSAGPADAPPVVSAAPAPTDGGEPTGAAAAVPPPPAAGARPAEPGGAGLPGDPAIAVAPSRATVPVHINVRPWALVFLDGRELGTTPLAHVPLAPGRHELRAVLPDGTEIVREVRVDAATRTIALP